ncbi:MAG TPA: transcriptional repressor LexA [Candidatus Dormibacteraeota bacterium]|nr:transcriptional repressor LexA [Candidatus Dormibacteraeota bacterium]
MLGALSESWTMEGTVAIPLLGEVAAGRPIEMFSVEETLEVPESMWHGRKVFALRVRGQSMIDAGIHDGDYLIVEPAQTADDGRTVVAEIDGQVTVKKLFRAPGGQVRLQPANPEMLPLIIGGDQVRIRGLVVGVLRKFGFRPAPTSPRGAGHPPRRSRPAATPRPARRPPSDGETLDLSLNAIDAQLERWRIVSERQAPRGARERAHLAQLGRDLQALREWYARTTKPVLRRALLADANRIIQRMQRHAARSGLATIEELPQG